MIVIKVPVLRSLPKVSTGRVPRNLPRLFTVWATLQAQAATRQGPWLPYLAYPYPNIDLTLTTLGVD